MTVRHLLRDAQDIGHFLKTYLVGDRIDNLIPGSNCLTTHATIPDHEYDAERRKGERVFEIELILKQGILQAFLKQLSDLPSFAPVLKVRSSSSATLDVDNLIRQIDHIKGKNEGFNFE